MTWKALALHVHIISHPYCWLQPSLVGSLTKSSITLPIDLWISWCPTFAPGPMHLCCLSSRFLIQSKTYQRQNRCGNNYVCKHNVNKTMEKLTLLRSCCICFLWCSECPRQQLSPCRSHGPSHKAYNHHRCHVTHHDSLEKKTKCTHSHPFHKKRNFFSLQRLSSASSFLSASLGILKPWAIAGQNFSAKHFWIWWRLGVASGGLFIKKDKQICVG